VAECHVFIGGSLNIKPVRFRELTFISVRRCMPNTDVIASFDQLTIDFCVPSADTGELDDRRRPPKDFFDSCVNHFTLF
tara:strand:+ start:1021 stop:1257 length:237 start_codon:yes stop_codon:yes gene_type:complete